MEKNIPWYRRESQSVDCNNTSYETSTVTSASWKKFLEENIIELPLLEAGNTNSAHQESIAVTQDVTPVTRRPALQSEGILSYRTNPVEIRNSVPKPEVHESFQQPLTSTPVAQDMHDTSFGKSSTYKVVKYLNLSGDSTDKIEQKIDKDSYSTHGQYYSTTSVPGKYESHRISPPNNRMFNDDQKPPPFHFWNHFCDGNIISPDVPSPVLRTQSTNTEFAFQSEEITNHGPIASPQAKPYSSARPFPTTPPPVHVNSLDSSSPWSVTPTSPPVRAGDLGDSAWNYFDHQKLPLDYDALNMTRHLVPPEYFSQNSSVRDSMYSHQRIPESFDRQTKTDIVSLMQELAVTYGCSRDGEDIPTIAGMQEDPVLKRCIDFCVFCKKNNQHATFYRSHTLRDRRGLCKCPVLRAYVCPLCKGTGDYAHTLKYCPYNSVTRGDPISAGLPPGKVTNWRNMAEELFSRKY